MITLLSALLGFFTSAMPDFFRMYQDKQDKAHELIIMEKQMEMQKAGHSQRLEEINANADISEARALYKTYSTGIHWVDSLNGTVRPVLAYAFFLLYFTVKCMQFSMVPEEALPWQIEILWSEEDRAIFAGIIAFYFGQRAMQKFRKA